MGESSNLRRNIESFKAASMKIGDQVNNVSGIWRDSNFASLQKQMGELAKASRSIMENGERTCRSIDKFFAIANENV